MMGLRDFRYFLLLATVFFVSSQVSHARSEAWRPLPESVRGYFSNQVRYRSNPQYYRAEFRRPSFAAGGGKSTLPRYVYSSSLSPWKAFASKEHELCWFTIVSGGECNADVPQVPSEFFIGRGENDVDLISYGRLLSQSLGMRRARDEMVDWLGRMDDSDGLVEKRFERAVSQKNYIPSDSLLRLKSRLRNRISVLVVLGYNHHRGDDLKVFEAAASAVRADGIRARLLEISPVKSSQHNAYLIFQQTKLALKNSDKIIFVGASKGVRDILTMLAEYGSYFTPAEKQSLELIVSLSGVVRYSFVGNFINQSKRLSAAILKGILEKFVLPSDDKDLSGLESLSVDIGEQYGWGFLSQFPNLNFLTAVSIPSGDNGFPPVPRIVRMANQWSYGYHRSVGPHDGMVEVSGSLLPSTVPVDQIVLRTYGQHSFLENKFLSGLTLSGLKKLKSDSDRKKGAADMLEALLRSLPKSLVGF
ncbi:hypothetical protein GW915_09170 [bacterium]|nr:hypothetical protein [bacterium]